VSFSFEGGGTLEMYLYQNYGRTFTEFTSKKICRLLKKNNLYSLQADSAWNRYYRTMELVIDSVVMYRPICLGSISHMEYVSFTEFLKDSYLNSMLETIFYKDMDVPKHITISDEMIRRAFDSLRAHLMEPLTDYEDILCSAPVEIRIDAINQDQKAWDEFIHLRNAFERSLFGSKKHAYHNATNNLKWRKLWLLKNEYKCFGTGPDGYHDIFLPLDCSDEDLLNYDFGDRAKMSNTPY
jgi:hypothetical protein